MRKQIIILISLTVTLMACSEMNKSETNNSVAKDFKELAEEDGFAEKHDIPAEIKPNVKGEFVKIKVSNSDDANIYKLTKEGAKNYLFVVHEWWGLNEHIINVAGELFNELDNINVIALDLYDGNVAKTREKAREYMQGAKEERLNNIINSVLNTLPSDARVGTIGWCFGGGWSLKTALLAKDKAVACVIFYGMPVDDQKILASLNSDALFIYANEDKWITPQVAKTFETNMKAVNKSVTVKGFNADHAFANPSSERYNESAAKEANKIALDYLKKRML